jgi:hypothetical protein
MALEYSKDLYGKTFANAYVRISQIRTKQDVLQTEVGLEENIEQVTEKIITGECIIQVFPDQATRDAGGETMKIDRLEITFDKTSTDNFYAQAYSHLKTLDEWSGATDV